MASSYLKNLYQDDGYYYTSNLLGMKQKVNYTPGSWTIFSGSKPSWQAGDQQSVVHDTLNNKYYGTQSFDDIYKGLEGNIARTQSELEKGYENRSTNMGIYSSNYRYNYTAKDIEEMNASIANQQKYLSQITKDNYTKEADTYFDSYEAYTQDYNNIYQRTYNNSVQAERNKETTARNVEIEKQNAAQLERNRLQIEANDRMAAQNAKQERENEKTRSRNKKIKGEAQAQQLQNQQGQTQNNGSRAKALTPNLEIGTGLLATAYRGLTNSGLTL